jgi:hypothetical protein
VTEPVAGNLDGERNTVTALFADIKGSTGPERDLDPEEGRAIVDPALKLMIDGPITTAATWRNRPGWHLCVVRRSDCA